jgi:hypothetical protein
MVNLNAPEFAIGTDKRELACRSEMKSAMNIIITEAIRRGWLECEITMALADVAEDHTMELANAGRAPLLRLVLPRKS